MQGRFATIPNPQDIRMKSGYYIYGLYDFVRGSFFYVGMTSRPAQRRSVHNSSHENRPHMFVILDYTSSASTSLGRLLEYTFIRVLRSAGHRLINKSCMRVTPQQMDFYRWFSDDINSHHPIITRLAALKRWKATKKSYRPTRPTP